MHVPQNIPQEPAESMSSTLEHSYCNVVMFLLWELQTSVLDKQAWKRALNVPEMGSRNKRSYPGEEP